MGTRSLRDACPETRRKWRDSTLPRARDRPTVSTYDVSRSKGRLQLARRARIFRAWEFQEWETRARELFAEILAIDEVGNLWRRSRAASRRASRHCIKKFTVYYLYIRVDVYINCAKMLKKILVFSLRRDREWREIVSLYINN